MNQLPGHLQCRCSSCCLKSDRCIGVTCLGTLNLIPAWLLCCFSVLCFSASAFQSHDMVLLFLFRFDFSCLFGLVLCSAIFCSFLFFLLCLVVLFAESAFLRFPAFLQQSKQHNNQSSKLHKARARPLRSKELETKNLIILTIATFLRGCNLVLRHGLVGYCVWIAFGSRLRIC